VRARAGFSAVLALGFASLSAGCSQSDAPPERGPATFIDPSTTGSIAGTVAYVGDPPPPTQLSMSGDPSCTAAHPGSTDAGDVVVRDGKLANVFVFVEKGLEGKVFDRPTAPVAVDQTQCMFAPRVVGAQTGQPIEFANGDPTLHNVHVSPERSAGVNFGLAHKGARRAIRIDSAEIMVPIRCDVHPWMRAFVGVLDNPYFAVTGSDGSFRFDRVPAGRYTVGAWHERFGRKTEEMTVVSGKETTVDVSFGR
jgi:plastocyanin